MHLGILSMNINVDLLMNEDLKNLFTNM